MDSVKLWLHINKGVILCWRWILRLLGQKRHKTTEEDNLRVVRQHPKSCQARLGYLSGGLFIKIGVEQIFFLPSHVLKPPPGWKPTGPCFKRASHDASFLHFEQKKVN